MRNDVKTWRRKKKTYSQVLPKKLLKGDEMVLPKKPPTFSAAVPRTDPIVSLSPGWRS